MACIPPHKGRLPSIIAGIWTFLSVSLVHAADNAATGFSPQASYLMTAGEPVKYLAKAFFYIAIMVVLYIFIKKYFLPQGLTFAGGQYLRVLRKLPLETQAALYLVQVGKAHMVLGVGAKQITVIKELTAAEAKAFEVVPPTTSPLSDPFKSYLAKYLTRKKK